MKKQEQTKEQTKEEIQTTQEIAKSTKHSYKLTPEDKQSITLDYYLNRTKENIASICTRYNISTRTLYNVVKNKDNQKAITSYINDCKNDFNKKTTILIDKALDQLNQKIEEGDTNIKDLVTTFGILYDKNRLENNLSTSNKELHINIKIE